VGARKGVIVMWVSGALSAPKEMVENKKQKTKNKKRVAARKNKNSEKTRKRKRYFTGVYNVPVRYCC